MHIIYLWRNIMGHGMLTYVIGAYLIGQLKLVCYEVHIIYYVVMYFDDIYYVLMMFGIIHTRKWDPRESTLNCWSAIQATGPWP